MKKAGKSRSAWWIAAGIVLGSVIGIQLFLSFYFNPLVRQRIQDIVVNGSDSLYRISLEQVRANLFTRSVHISNLHIYADSIRYRVLEQQQELPPLTFEITLGKGKVRGIALFAFLFRKEIRLADIVSEDATVSLYRHFKTNDTIATDNGPLWKQIRPAVQGIYVDDIVLDNLSLSYRQADSARAFNFRLGKCHAAFRDIQVDSLGGMDPARMLYTKDIGILLRDIRMQTADSLYTYQAQQVVYSSKDRSVGVKDFRLYPAVDKATFYRKLGHQKEMYDVTLPSVRLVNFMLPAFVRDNQVLIDSVTLTNPQLRTYNDRTFTSVQENKMGNYPQQTIHKMPFAVYIKTIVLNNGLVAHTERNAITRMEGKMVFQQVNGTLNHISNRVVDIERQANLEADLHAVFMDNCKLHALFHIPLASTQGEFRVEADAGPLDAAQLNRLTVPLAQTSVKSFRMNQLHYEAWGNEQVIYANLDMTYRDLAIEIKEKEKQEMKGKPLLSFVMNNLVVVPENPMKLGNTVEVRRGRHAVVKRDPNRAYFNQLWMAMFWSARQIILRDFARNIPMQRK